MPSLSLRDLTSTRASSTLAVALPLLHWRPGPYSSQAMHSASWQPIHVSPLFPPFWQVLTLVIRGHTWGQSCGFCRIYDGCLLYTARKDGTETPVLAGMPFVCSKTKTTTNAYLTGIQCLSSSDT